MHQVIVVHHHEITLKGSNRPFFEKRLHENIRKALGGLVPKDAVRGGYGRFVIRLDSEIHTAEIAGRLADVFGISNICAGIRVEQSIEAFGTTAISLLGGREFRTIRVVARRVDKRFPVNSMAVNAAVGEILCRHFGVKADLSRPDETVYIEIVDGAAYVYLSKARGAGGLPTGVSGRVVGLLSAGFDSPVACWTMMKRGSHVIMVHFHSMPYTSRHSVDQVRRLAEVLTRYQFTSRLYLVPFAAVQQTLVLQVPQPLRIIFYRRMMIRVAEEIAARENAEALVTGESVGQVASQTLRNIRVIDEAARLPVLRPLSGSDKEETMAAARRIGTYEISKEPFDDCCSFLAPRRPETWADPRVVREVESALSVPELTRLGLSEATLERFAFPDVPQAAVLDESL